jgi:hypothetical protein
MVMVEGVGDECRSSAWLAKAIVALARRLAVIMHAPNTASSPRNLARLAPKPTGDARRVTNGRHTVNIAEFNHEFPMHDPE